MRMSGMLQRSTNLPSLLIDSNGQGREAPATGAQQAAARSPGIALGAAHSMYCMDGCE